MRPIEMRTIRKSMREIFDRKFKRELSRASFWEWKIRQQKKEKNKKNYIFS